MINRAYYCMSLLYCHDEVQYVQIVNKSMSMSMSIKLSNYSLNVREMMLPLFFFDVLKLKLH